MSPPKTLLSPQSSLLSSFNPNKDFKFPKFPPPATTSPLLFTPSKTKLCRVLCSNSSPSDHQPEKAVTLVSLLRVIPDWADNIKELGMQKKRTLYNHEDWLQHRSSLRHLRHLLSSFSSRVILSLIPPVIAFTLFAVAIAGYNSSVELGLLPGFFPVLKASTLPYQLTAPALALLLVFRTEASYSRFEQGRKAWTTVVSGLNDFAGLVVSVVDAPADSALKHALLCYIMAFPVALKCHVIYGSDARRDLLNLLEKDDLAVVLKSRNRPRCIINFISQSLHMLDIEESKKNLLESKIYSFHEGIDVCEQLIGVPIPLSYTRLTSRFLVLWHFTLPIILWEDCHWIVVPATFISAASLFCIEEVGVLIEEPFPMLALDDVCSLVQNNIHEAIASEKSIKAQLAEKKRKTHSREHSTNGRPNS